MYNGFLVAPSLFVFVSYAHTSLSLLPPSPWQIVIRRAHRRVCGNRLRGVWCVERGVGVRFVRVPLSLKSSSSSYSSSYLSSPFRICHLPSPASIPAAVRFDGQSGCYARVLVFVCAFVYECVRERISPCDLISSRCSVLCLLVLSPTLDLHTLFILSPINTHHTHIHTLAPCILIAMRAPQPMPCKSVCCQRRRLPAPFLPSSPPSHRPPAMLRAVVRWMEEGREEVG